MRIVVSEYELERFFKDKDLITLDELVDKLFELDAERDHYQEECERLSQPQKEDCDKYEDCLLGLM